MKGYYLKKFPSVQILRGWDPQEPTTLATTHPIATDAAGEPIDIADGQVISLNKAGTAWILGVEADATPAQINSIAIAQDGTDIWDVMDADNNWDYTDPQTVGSLVGLSCTGKFRIATPYFAKFDNAGTAYEYKAGTPITFCKTTDTIKTLEPSSTKPGELEKVNVKSPAGVVSSLGYIRPAAKDEVVIGIVAETHKGINREDAGIPGNPTAISAHALQKTIGKAINSEAVWYNSYYVVFDTNLTAQTPTA